MKEVTIYSSTVELVRAAVASDRDTVVTGTVGFGFTDDEATEPDPGDYTAGTWNSTAPTVEEIDGKFLKAYIAQILVSGPDGGGSVELAEGEHFVWTRVAMADGQTPVKLAGKVTVL